MSNILKITAVVPALVLAGYYAQAAESKVINLSCDGTVGSVLDPTTKEPVEVLGACELAT